MRSPSQNNYKSNKRRTSVLHVGLCWLLCLTVWRGPVPVVHQHALDLNSLVSNNQLAEHAIAYHADCLSEDCLDHEETGLHVHFMLLDQFPDSLLADSHGNSHHDIGAVDTILKLQQQDCDALTFKVAQSQVNQSDLPHITEDLRFSSTATASFLQTRIYSTPALAVLCVCLC